MGLEPLAVARFRGLLQVLIPSTCASTPLRRPTLMHHGGMSDGLHSGFERFHFRPRYKLEVDPEFPGDGQWGCPVFGFDRDGRIMERFASRWGAPLTVRVQAPSQVWVGMFAAGGLGGLRGVFACPSPSGLCAVVDGEAYLVEVDHPERG